MPEVTRKPRTPRQKAQRLNAILTSHDAWEKRTLSDLRVAGFNFATIQQANRHRAALATMARMTPDDLVEFVADSLAKEKAR